MIENSLHCSVRAPQRPRTFAGWDCFGRRLGQTSILKTIQISILSREKKHRLEVVREAHCIYQWVLMSPTIPTQIVSFGVESVKTTAEYSWPSEALLSQPRFCLLLLTRIWGSDDDCELVGSALFVRIRAESPWRMRVSSSMSIPPDCRPVHLSCAQADQADSRDDAGVS